MVEIFLVAYLEIFHIIQDGEEVRKHMEKIHFNLGKWELLLYGEYRAKV